MTIFQIGLIGIGVLLVIAAVLVLRRPKEKSIGTVILAGRKLKVMPLTIRRMDRTLLWIEATIDPTQKYTAARTLAGASRVLKVACPGLRWSSALNRAPAAEVERAFHQVMKLWGMGSQ